LSGEREWPQGAVVVTFDGDRVDAYPRERLAYFPAVPALREASGTTFAEGEDLEFRKHDRPAAIQFFRKLAGASDPAVQAGALSRLARNLAAGGQTDEALTAYGRLTAFDGVSISDTPAGLIARYARSELLDKAERSAERDAEVRQLASELQAGRWRLIAPVYRLYAADVARWTGMPPTSNRENELFAEAAESLWQRRQSLPATGQQRVSISGENIVILWQNSSGSLRALIAAPEFIGSQWLGSARTVAAQQSVEFRINEQGSDEAGLTVRRMAAQTELPWNLLITNSARAKAASDFVMRRRLLAAGFVLLVALAAAAGYVIVRAVGREIAVARLQSDFVAAVSHEFRTPLTSLRQFTDMLRENERFAPAEGKERRLLAYEAQSRAAERLTKLVESLLDFGRMEAGARRYTFERRDCTQFVGSVVEDFRGTAEAAGYNVKFNGNGSAPIAVDEEALARAIWNLLDNAVKYSPDHQTVEVAVHRQGADVAIDVQDHGIGIPASERAVVFGKFQRGEQARVRGIKGTGIGLAMVDEIVRAHRGYVDVKSEPGEGSTFTIVLPVKE
jgi:signal transduction histidine kinase